MKTLKIMIHVNQKQKIIIDDWINTSNYVYNKTLEKIKKGHKINFMSLRDLLVTNNTKKNSNEYKLFDDKLNKLRQAKKDINNKIKKSKNNEIFNKELDIINDKINKINKERRESVKKIKSTKNNEIKNWELKTPKEIRASAVNDVCISYKAAFSNLKNNNITNFNLNYRKKKDNNKSITIPKTFIKFEKNKIIIAPKFLKENMYFKINKKTLKKNKIIKIENDVRLKKENNKYYLYIPQEITYKNNKNECKNYCGVDPGLRTFMTTFSNSKCYEYKHNKQKINIKNKELDSLKRSKKRIRKKALNKRELYKSNLINDIHWKTITHLLNNNDVIFYGDIKSHNIVKHKRYKHINRAFNDLKLYKFKERLLYKASIKNKYVILVDEAYTSQTCSYCGKINKPGSSEIYTCKTCNINIGRDINASKNILMKGIINTSPADFVNYQQ